MLRVWLWLLWSPDRLVSRSQHTHHLFPWDSCGVVIPRRRFLGVYSMGHFTSTQSHWGTAMFFLSNKHPNVDAALGYKGWDSMWSQRIGVSNYSRKVRHREAAEIVVWHCVLRKDVWLCPLFSTPPVRKAAWLNVKGTAVDIVLYK